MKNPPPSPQQLTLATLFRVFLLSVLGLLAIAYAVSGWVAPLPDNLDAVANQFTAGAQTELLPEPRERAIYILLCLFLPLVASGAFLVDRAWQKHADAYSKDTLQAGSLLVAMAFLIILLSSLFFRCLCATGGHETYLLSALIAAGLTWFVFVRNAKLTNRLDYWLWVPAVVYCLLVTLSYRIFDYHLITPSPEFRYTFSAVLYSVSQVANGGRLLIDFPSQYGLFPLYLKPLFHLTGLSILTFTTVMALLQAGCILLLASLMTRWLRNPLWRTLFLLALTYQMGAWYQVLITWDTYFQYYPIRLLFPVLLLVLVNWHLRASSWRSLVAVSLVTGFGVLWNLDSGIVCCGAWLALLLARGGARLRMAKRLYPGAMAECVAGAGGILAGFLAAYLSLAWLNGGRLPLGELFRYQATFYGAGFGMLPMPLSPHPWMAVAAIYVGAMIYGIRGLWSRAPRMPTGQEQFVLLLGVLGAGLFSYYQGRSHDFVMITAAWPAWLLIMLATERLGTSIGPARLPRLLLLPVGIIMFVAVAWSLNLLASTDRYASLAANSYRQWRDRTPTAFTRAVDVFRQESVRNGGKPLLILSQLQAMYYTETGLRSPFQGPSLVESLLRRDTVALAETLSKEAAAHEVAVDATFDLPYASRLWSADGAGAIMTPLHVIRKTEGAGGVLFLRQPPASAQPAIAPP